MLEHTELKARFHSGVLIGGQWRNGRGPSMRVISPLTGETLTTVNTASPEDVNQAVTSSSEAALRWGSMPGAERGRILLRAAELIEQEADQFAELEALDVGKSALGTAAFDVQQAVRTFRYFAGWADKINGQTVPTGGFAGRRTLSYTRREPIGVIAAVLPWNAPLMISSWKLAPALAAGNAVLLKPSEDAPLSVLHLAELLRRAGLPDGVVNVVTGASDVGAALVCHPAVNKISFTGSPAAATEIQRATAGQFKRMTLELGGKSPQIVMPDARLEEAVEGLAAGLFTNSGQVCAAGSRVLVHRSIHDEVLAALVAKAEQQVLGDPRSAEVSMGPLINSAQRANVLKHIERAKSDGAQVAFGGTAPDRAGFFVNPTIFTGVDNQMRIAQEEVFGPVGVVIPFDDERDAIAIANDTPYGLTATLWTQDLSRAHAMAADLRSGAVWVNAWSPLDPALPWGGMGLSGLGRELGWSGILEDTEEKVVTIVL